ncbi:MAG TPA: hypothetical protein VKT83_18790 [bacterium]|nr:hypothetical protein [bacterium]
MMSREEWRKEIGPFWEDAMDEAMERGLAFVILGGRAPSRKPPKGGSDDWQRAGRVGGRAVPE